MKTPNLGFSGMIFSLNSNSASFFSDSRLNSEDLLGNDRQHFDIDSVELIETGPSSTLGQTREESAHHLVVKSIRAVEDHALYSQCFGEILGGFSLSSSSWALGVASIEEVEGASESHIALISEWGDNQSGSITQSTHIHI